MSRLAGNNSLLRYFEVTAGYGTRGYESGQPGVERRRNVYFGLSLNLSEILAQTVFRGTSERSGARRSRSIACSCGYLARKRSRRIVPVGFSNENHRQDLRAAASGCHPLDAQTQHRVSVCASGIGGFSDDRSGAGYDA